MGEPLPETPTGAARGLVLGLALGCAFRCVEKFGPNTYADSAVSGILAAGLTVVDYKLKSVLEWVGPRATAVLNRTASNPVVWILFFALYILQGVLSPYVEQRRWPYAGSSAPSAEDIANAVIQKLPSAKAEADQIVALQIQLVNTQKAAQETATALSQLQASNRQQIAAQNNQFSFPPFPIINRKLTHSEAAEIIDKFSVFTNAFKSLDSTMADKIVASSYYSRRYSLSAPALSFSQKADSADGVSKKLKDFTNTLNEAISEFPTIKSEVDNMLGGGALGGFGYSWIQNSSIEPLTQALDNYSQTERQIASRPTKADDELIGCMMRDSQAALLYRTQIFNSWRGQIPLRIQEIQNEARKDL